MLVRVVVEPPGGVDRHVTVAIGTFPVGRAGHLQLTLPPERVADQCIAAAQGAIVRRDTIRTAARGAMPLLLIGVAVAAVPIRVVAIVADTLVVAVRRAAGLRTAPALGLIVDAVVAVVEVVVAVEVVEVLEKGSKRGSSSMETDKG